MAKFKDICTKIGSGATPRGGKEAYCEDGISLIRSQNVLDFTFSAGGLVYINELQAEKLKNVIVEEDDVLLNITGDSVARACIVDKNYLPARVNQHVCIIRADSSKVIPSYLLYYLQLNKEYLLQLASGGATRNALTKDMVNNLELELPTVEEQQKIVAVLNDIQKKIYCNNAVNENLEQQAKALFKSWFVDFDPFGGIQPSEMQFVPLQDLCKVVTKGTTPTTLGKPFATSGINFIKAESILNNHSIDSCKFAYIDDETNYMLKRSIINANDIIFTIAGTLGRFALVDESILPANTNQAVAIIRPDHTKISSTYLYSFFIGNWHNEYYSKRVQQAVQANLSLTTIKSLPIALLDKKTMNQYDKLVCPLFSMMKNNEEENRKLAILRDSLLPKLMSGEIDISNLDL